MTGGDLETPGPRQRREAFFGLHRPGCPLFLPNAWDYASAAALAAAGYPAIGTTSLGVAAAAGKPDATGQTGPETLALTRRLGRLPALLTVDIEAGFSDDPHAVAQFAEQVADAGAVGVNIEDGRPDGTLDRAEQHCAKIAAISARVPALFINARTDAFWLAADGAPPPIEEAVARATAYIAAGADGIFVPAAADPAVIAILATRIAAPLNILYLPGRHTFAELAAAGTARVSTGSLLFRVALQATVRAAAQAAGQEAGQEAGTASGQGAGGEPGIPSYSDVQAMIGDDDGNQGG
jgi:2-methylisocitrate lyase-like PEP mutase family enzyme